MSEKIKILSAFLTVAMNDLKRRMTPKKYQDLLKEGQEEQPEK